MKKKSPINIKFTVIVGYLLVIAVMVFGLVGLYNNLVDYSNKRINNQDLSELLLVSNTLSLLYEIESDQNLLTPESAENYFSAYDSIIPVINENITALKEFADDTVRVLKLDSISLLIDMKKENLHKMAVLLDSIRRAPQVIIHTESSYVPRKLNREIADYLEGKKQSAQHENKSDTTVVAGERRRFVDRIRDVFDGRADTTVIIESQSVVADNEYLFVVDTIINKIRHYERLDMQRQNRFQRALLERQEIVSHTNRMLTGRIDDLLKEIEHEEMAKSYQLILDKEKALSKSVKTMRFSSILAMLIALVFAVFFLIDINKSQRYRKQLETSNRRISDLLAARERMMLTISHDIKAPISSILGYIELIGNSVDINDGCAYKVNREYLENMKQSGSHILQLVSALLDYHKVESGAWQMEEANTNLKLLTDETALSFRPLAIQKGLNFQVDNQVAETKKFYLDPYVMRQIMSNLISNAIKYTPNGSVSIAASIEQIGDVDSFMFKVIDTGIGISSENQELIFQDFKQIKETYNELNATEGSGLGLSITKAFVEQMKGSITMVSEENKGSEFTVRIPLNLPQEKIPLKLNEPIEYNDGKHTKDYKNIEGLSILIVDDNPVQLMMTSEMLSLLNVKTVTEQYPERVINLLTKESFDMLLLDLQMPTLDGIKLVKKIRHHLELHSQQQLPIIALSARSDISKEELQKIGFSGFLTKPFTSNQLYDVIEQIYPHLVSSSNLFAFKKHDKSSNNIGVQALIDFVKDDKEASLNIITSFVEETSQHIKTLDDSFNKLNYQNAGKIAHTILPLVRIIGGDTVISLLECLEKNVLIQPDDEQFIITWLNDAVDEAKQLIDKLKNE